MGWRYSLDPLTYIHNCRCSSELAYQQPTQALLLRQLREHQVVPQENDQTDKIFGAVGMPDVNFNHAYMLTMYYVVHRSPL